MHIVGMAKSSLDLKGAKGPKLELDFFKLAFAVASLRAEGKRAVGYLQVLAPLLRDRALAWIEKYQTGDAVVVLCAEPNVAELAELAAEKVRNALGLLPDSERADDALASIGEELGERELAAEIRRRHVTVQQISDRGQFPQRIRWDFCGIATDPPLGGSVPAP